MQFLDERVKGIDKKLEKLFQRFVDSSERSLSMIQQRRKSKRAPTEAFVSYLPNDNDTMDVEDLSGGYSSYLTAIKSSSANTKPNEEEEVIRLTQQQQHQKTDPDLLA